MTIEPTVRVFDDNALLAQEAARLFTALAAASANEGKPFTVALAGGSTPKALYRLLASPPYRAAIDWQNVHLFFGDERCVPPESEDSNFQMVQTALLAPLANNSPNNPTVYRMPAETPDHDLAARAYADELHRFFSSEEVSEGHPAAFQATFQQATSQSKAHQSKAHQSEMQRSASYPVPRFDLVLLGMGPDGHTASLFPHKPALQERERLVVASDPGLSPFVPRLTLTYPVLNSAANVLFLVEKEDKAETVARVLEGPPDPDGLPSQAVRPTRGALTWFLDRPAASRLTSKR